MDLEEASDFVEAGKEDGVRCPCCDQLCKRRKRKIHAEMAVFLVKLYRLSSTSRRVVEVREVVNARPKASTDASYLRLWGLVEKHGNGSYRITKEGKRFVEKKAQVAKWAHVFNNEADYFSGPQVDIDDCLGERFDLHEVLHGS